MGKYNNIGPTQYTVYNTGFFFFYSTYMLKSELLGESNPAVESYSCAMLVHSEIESQNLMSGRIYKVKKKQSVSKIISFFTFPNN